MKVSELLRVLREQQGLGQEAIAEWAVVPLSTLREYEQGRRLPAPTALRRLITALGVSWELFASCEDVAVVYEEH
jgi:transcriptional regulator with XRE-family HTH domain